MFEGGQGFVQGLKHGAKTEGLQETSESGSQAYSTEKALAEAENRGIRYGRVARDTAFGTTLGTGMGGAVGELLARSRLGKILATVLMKRVIVPRMKAGIAWIRQLPQRKRPQKRPQRQSRRQILHRHNPLLML